MLWCGGEWYIDNTAHAPCHTTFFHLHLIGIKVFCLVLASGFLYDWHVARGREDPLRGANYMYKLIFETLLFDNIWNFCNAIVFCDAAFTSISLFRDLYEKRGIYVVGPINAGKPKCGGGPSS